MRFWSMQGGWVEPLQFNGSPLYLANQLSILSLANGAICYSYMLEGIESCSKYSLW